MLDSLLVGDVCPNCGAVNSSDIVRTHRSTKIGSKSYRGSQSLVKRFHVCNECGYHGRAEDKGDAPPFNTVAIREDRLKFLILLSTVCLSNTDSIVKFVTDNELDVLPSFD